MRPVRHLGRLNEAADRRLKRIESTVTNLVLPADSAKDAIVAFAVIELDNTWSGFVRCYYLSWFLAARAQSGQRVRLKSGLPTKFNQAIAFASTAISGGPRKGVTGRIEPPWHEKRVLLTLTKACGASHHAQVLAAMSVRATAFDFLHTVRNFYAHRGEETADKLPRIARAFGLLPSRRATEIVLAIPPKGSSTILLDWIAEVRLVIELLCA
jgi:hypothetical protein